MMFLPYSGKSLLVLWLCLFSLADFKSLPDLVLCFGEDGHIELESAAADRCGKGENPKPSSGLAWNPEEFDHCGDCSDIPLLAGIAQIANLKTFGGSISGWESIGIVPPAHTFRLIENDQEMAPFLFPPTVPRILASIRSVRLLV